MDARVRATQGAVAEEPEVTAGGRIASGTAIEDALALPGGRLNAQNVNLFLREPLGAADRYEVSFGPNRLQHGGK